MEELKVAPTPTIKALISHYQSVKDRVISDLELYLNRPVGVGGHNTVFDETKELFEKFEKANSMLTLLNKVVSDKTSDSDN